jgi:serine/threonine-protein kinase HipA
VLKAVTETVERVNQSWWSLPERAVLPDRVLERVDAHVNLMSPILGTCAD